MVAVDSVAALVPRAELEGEIGQTQGESHGMQDVGCKMAAMGGRCMVSNAHCVQAMVWNVCVWAVAGITRLAIVVIESQRSCSHLPPSLW